jgi:hypothetical protein
LDDEEDLTATKEELRRLVAEEMRRKKENEPILKTKYLREKERLQKLSKFRKVKTFSAFHGKVV